VMLGFGLNLGAIKKPLIHIIQSLFSFSNQTEINQITGDRDLVNIGTNGVNAVCITDEPFDPEFLTKGDDITVLNIQASTFDWNFTEPAGVLSVGYTGTRTFPRVDGNFIRVDGKLLAVN